jgi:outer membrane lipoprotein-sorting protein
MNGTRHGRRSAALPAAAGLLALAVVLLSGVLGPAVAEEGEALLERVGERYAGARTLSANFRQEVPLQNLGIVRRASGKVYLGRPLKMRWDYHSAEAQIFLADGKYFYFRPPDSPQVIRRKADEKSLGGKIPLLLLFGQGRIGEMFRVEGATPRGGGEETVLRLAPRGEGAPEVRRVDLVVGTADAIIREVHLYDRLGGENHLYLSEVTFNPSLPDDLFRFKRPRGVTVVDG